MSCAFGHVSPLLVANVPDAAPDTTPPDDARLIKLNIQPPNGRGGTTANGIDFYFASDNASTGTVTWTAWARDSRTGTFVKIGAGVATVDRVMVGLDAPLGADVFVQITAIAGFAAATSIETRATEAVL